MTTGLTSTTVVNRAIDLIGNNQPLVTGSAPNFDNSTSGIAAATLYAGVVQTVGRQFGWDFSRNIATLALTGNSAPMGYAYEYTYPANGIEIRELIIQTISDPNNPLPQRWTVGNTTVSGTPTKVIWTNLQNANAAFSNQPPESLWDAGFTEAVVRLLASELAQALAGKPDTSRDMLSSAQVFENDAEGRDG